MATIQNVVSAINALAAKLDSAGGGSTIAVSAATGTLGWNGLCPTVYLPGAVDPKDFFRASAVITLDFNVSCITAEISNAGEAMRANMITAARTVRKVFTIDGVAGIAMDQRTVVLPPVPLGTSFYGEYQSKNKGNGVVSDFATASFVAASSALQVLTRYHYVG